MFDRIDDFERIWQEHAAATLKLFRALTDASLSQPVAEGHRTLGRIAWHVVLTIGEMAARTGLSLDCPAEDESVPGSAAAIADAYNRASTSLAEVVRSEWTDETLEVEDDMYGSEWRRGLTLWILIEHEIHHRGQMTVLMRQAGITVPGIYGPAKEEWSAFGQSPPEV